MTEQIKAKDYVPFGDEWEREVSQFTKVQLIERWRRTAQERDDLRTKLAAARDALAVYTRRENWGINDDGECDSWLPLIDGRNIAVKALAIIDKEGA